MALFSNSPPASGQVGVNHAVGVTGLESLVRRHDLTTQIPHVVSIANESPCSNLQGIKTV